MKTFSKFYNTQAQVVTDFPDRELLQRQITQTVCGLYRGFKRQAISFKWLAPISYSHTREYYTVEETLHRLRRLVGATTQRHVVDPRMFLHQVRDSDTVGLTPLYLRYVRSLLANCVSRVSPSPDFVSIIQRGEYNCMYFVNFVGEDELTVDLEVTALLCPHVEPDWALDDFCRREVQIYARDLYGDRCAPSREQYIQQEGLDEYTDDELREFAYQRSTFACAISWRNLGRDAIITLLYSYEQPHNKRPNMSTRDRLGILSSRIEQGVVFQDEALYWLQVLGFDYTQAFEASQSADFDSRLLRVVTDYLAHEE